MSQINPEGQQLDALDKLRQWWRDVNAKRAARPFFALYGFAGTGKTSLVRFFLDELRLTPSDVALMTFTGKAARVLESRAGLPASTIHSQIYSLTRNTNGRMEWARKVDASVADRKLFILDECSQIGKQMFADLLAYNVPMIILGDPGQLPPINDLDIINSTAPDVFLTEIHRQALDNPIIYLSKLVREGGNIDFGQYGDAVKKIRKEELDPEELHVASMILVGRNNTRTYLNQWFRATYDRTSPIPQKDDRLICLRNQPRIGLFNGLTGKALADAVETVDPHNIKVDIFVDDNENVYLEQPVLRDTFQPVFGDNGQIVPLGQDGYPLHLENRQKMNLSRWDYAYAITVHKSQGSQFEHTILYDEWNKADRTRWLYTACTRSISKLTILA